MAIKIDFLGYRYDNSIPAFVLLPAPPHPKNTAGSSKLVFHRMTGTLYDYLGLASQMQKKGYTPPVGEFARSDDYLRAHTPFAAPYEFTFAMGTISSGGQMYFTVKGGPATKAQRVTMAANSPQGALLLPYYTTAPTGNERTYFDIAIGDTDVQVAAKVRAAFSLRAVNTTPTYAIVPSASSSANVTLAKRLLSRQPGLISTSLIDAKFTGVNLEPWTDAVPPALAQPVLVEGGKGASFARFRFRHGDVVSFDGFNNSGRGIATRDISVGGVFAAVYAGSVTEGDPVRVAIDRFVSTYGSRNMTQPDSSVVTVAARREYDDLVFYLTTTGSNTPVLDFDPLLSTY
jgi:hypothetical protein